MRHKTILRSPDDVVDAFGGTRAAADWAGVGMSTVSNWLARGYIPPGWHFRMHEHFEPQGLLLADTVFGAREDGPHPRVLRATA